MAVTETSVTRAWFDDHGWRLEPSELRAALEERGADPDTIIELIDAGADRRRAHAEQAHKDAPLAYTPAEHVLGALLLAGALGPEMSAATLERVDAAGLQTGMFARERDQRIYQAIRAVIGRGEPSEWVIVERELAVQHHLDQAGGPAYIRELARLAPAIENVAAYARLVIDDDYRRNLETIGLRVTEAARNGGVNQDLRDTLSRLVEHAPDQQTSDRLEPGGRFILDEPATGNLVWGSSDDEVAWAAGEGLMIAGPQGIGKTTLMQQLALARIGLRTHILGMPVTDDERPVLYIAADRPRQAQRSLHRMVTDHDRGRLDERLIVHRGPPTPLVTSDPSVLANLAKKTGAGTIIIDSLKDVAAKLADDDYGGRINLAFQAAISQGVELLVGHHQRKASTDNKKPNKLDDVYGSTWITSGLGSVLLLWGEAGDAIVELNHLKQPREELGPWNLHHDHTRGTTSVAKKPDLVSILHQVGTDGLTAAAAAELTLEKADPSRNEIEKTRRKLERLCTAGRAVKHPGTPTGPGTSDRTVYLYNGGTKDTLQ